MERDKHHGPGRSYIDEHFEDDGLSVERCAHLLLRAIAAKSDEAWIVRSLSIAQLGIYLAAYLPWLYPALVKTKAKDMVAEFVNEQQ